MRVLGTACLVLALTGCASENPDSPPASDGSAPEAPGPAEQSQTGEAAVATDASAPSAKTKPVACQANEEALFSCTATNGKLIAVCGSGRGNVEYRYGKGDSELALSAAEWASVAYSGGGEAQIAFDNGDTRYIVFSRIVRTNFKAGEPNYPAITDGVIVQRGEKVLNLQVCGGEGDLKPVDYNVAERLIAERRNELFSYETILADPEWANKE